MAQDRVRLTSLSEFRTDTPTKAAKAFTGRGETHEYYTFRTNEGPWRAVAFDPDGEKAFGKTFDTKEECRELVDEFEALEGSRPGDGGHPTRLAAALAAIAAKKLLEP